jgi:(S)-ureidoglycine aminohydrolase
LMKYSSKNPADPTRGKSSENSFVKDWNKIEYKPHDRGGRRDFFELPTSMCKRFEMHVTSLNAGLKSHDPHTHRAEEIVLILEGKTEMQIENKFYKATEGDVIFLSSGSLHGIRNEGTTPCSYFAFQFE